MSLTSSFYESYRASCVIVSMFSHSTVLILHSEFFFFSPKSWGAQNIFHLWLVGLSASVDTRLGVCCRHIIPSPSWFVPSSWSTTYPPEVPARIPCSTSNILEPDWSAFLGLNQTPSAMIELAASALQAEFQKQYPKLTETHCSSLFLLWLKSPRQSFISHYCQVDMELYLAYQRRSEIITLRLA